MLTQDEIVDRLWGNGYKQFTLVHGKLPMGNGWQLGETPPERMRELARIFPRAQSIGFVCGNVIGIDVDILHKEAGDAVEQLIRDRFPGAHLLVRFGRRPRRLFMFRTAEPFPGFKAILSAPESSGLEVRNGRVAGGPRLEILGRGAQFVAFGIHEGTNAPYEWPDGSPLDVKFDDLTEVNEADLRELIK